MLAANAILDATDDVDEAAIAGHASNALTLTESASNVSAKRSDTIQDLSGAAYLYGSVSGWLGNAQHDIQGFKAYLEKLLQDAKTTDVIERMLVEELVWAHHNVGRLLVRASVAKDADEQKVLNAGAVRLMGEFRRCALAVQSYRAAATKAKMTVKGYLPISAAFPSLRDGKASAFPSPRIQSELPPAGSTDSSASPSPKPVVSKCDKPHVSRSHGDSRKAPRQQPAKLGPLSTARSDRKASGPKLSADRSPGKGGKRSSGSWRLRARSSTATLL